jgi:hypothetical protein
VRLEEIVLDMERIAMKHGNIFRRNYSGGCKILANVPLSVSYENFSIEKSKLFICRYESGIQQEILEYFGLKNPGMYEFSDIQKSLLKKELLA